MSTFVKYLDEVEIIESWITGWQTIDLASYGVDAAATAVTLRIIGSPADESRSGARGVGAAGPLVTFFNRNTYAVTATPLAGGSSVQIYMETTDTGRIFITGEVHDDNAVMHTVPVFVNAVEADFGAWQARQVTPEGGDVVDDIAAAIIAVWQFDEGTSGVREVGSTNTPLTCPFWGGYRWLVVGLDEDGFYETYTTGTTGSDLEDAFFFEVGYVLKTSNVVTFINRLLPELITYDTNWNIFDTTNPRSHPPLPANAITVGTRLRNAFSIGIGKQGFCRGIGGVQPPKRQIRNLGGIATQMVSLIANEFEYKVVHVFTSLHMEWYETTTAVPDTRTVLSATSTANAPAVLLTGVATRFVTAVDSTANAPAAGRSSVLGILGLAKGIAEARAAVAGTAEVHAAVAGTAEASAARKA